MSQTERTFTAVGFTAAGFTAVCFFVVCSLLLPCAGIAEVFYEEDLVFDPQKRTPDHVHASCIVICPNGDLLSVWYENAPSREGFYYTKDSDKSDDVRIAAARKRHGADAWSEPFVIADTFGVADNNPCMVIDKEERLWLIYTAMMAAPIETWDSGLLRYKVSSDYMQPGPPRWEYDNILIVHPNGLDEIVARAADERRRFADWDNDNEKQARQMLEMLNNPFDRRLGWMPRAHPLILKNGTLLLPLANENFYVAGMALTDDGGRTWRYSKCIPGGLPVEQPSVAQRTDGSLIAMFRDAGDTNRILRSESSDNGMTWSPIQFTELLNPGAGIEVIALQSGNLALVYNDKQEGARDKLAVSLSTDGGDTWKWTRHLENTPNGRFDYPSIVQAKDGTLHASYSYNLKTVKHVHFNEDWIKQGD